MSASRPYLNKTIIDLEKIYVTAHGDLDALVLLDAELKHRSVPRAVALAAKVAADIAILRVGSKERQGSLFPVSQQFHTIGGSQPASRQPPLSAGRPSKASPPATTTTSLHPARGKHANGKQRQGAISVPSLMSESAARPGQKASSANDPAAIISAWIAMEALSPQTYKRPESLAADDKRRIASLSADMPWTLGEKSRPHHRLFYEVVLGAIDMNPAGKALVAVFGPSEERERPDGQKAAIASIIVDSRGVPLEEGGIGVSSFAWALPKAISKELASLSRWPDVEPNAVEGLSQIIRRVDNNERPIPLDAETIDAAHQWLVQSFGLNPEHVEKPSFAIRIFHHFKAQGDPEPQLLNSFFLNDLSRALDLVTANKAPAALKAYLGITKPTATVDLLHDFTRLEEAVAPKQFPLSRWPMGSDRSLVLLQQAAVNLARQELQSEGVFAVNGPPGTGKSTLLRDMVADLVTRRAQVMASFQNPAEAFSASGHRVKAGADFWHLYRLDPRLKGFEILVASSNNKAVENVSRELPGLEAIARPGLTYFKSISDRLFNPPSSDVAEKDEASEPLKTWGLIAAVLGNRANINRFRQSFWWDEDFGMRLYLKAAKGDDIRIEIKDAETGKVTGYRTPKILDAEKPPAGEGMAGKAWSAAVRRFRTVESRVAAAIKAREQVRDQLQSIPSRRRNVLALRKDIAQAEVATGAAETASNQANLLLQTAIATFQSALGDMKQHLTLRPGFLARLFGSKVARDWKMRAVALAAVLKSSETTRNAARTEAGACDRRLSDSVRVLGQLREELLYAERNLRDAEAAIASWRNILGARFLDADFETWTHQRRQTLVPWLDAEIHTLREDLFAAALDLHRAFIGASAQRLLHNLSALFDLSKDAGTDDPQKKALLPDLWSTLFLIVPVVSTTFASVERMLGKLGPESIGWLLVDEAGQALPQAAVGAMMRSKRAMIVGDPIQIPPVVTLPKDLVEEISRFFQVAADDWAATTASAQTLADTASRFQSAFSGEAGERRVGAPLLVHRRCEEPMFSIANTIAYDGMMVSQVTQTDGGQIRAVLGPSRWIDVEGEASSKWCALEGEKVVELLRLLAERGISKPDVFIVTPFRVIANEMRSRLRREVALFRSLALDPERWVFDNVGTVHTVQGREADTVIFVLGAPKPAQGGARKWAGTPPNLTNVAVSRAKRNLYVIGSRSAWCSAGSFSVLAYELRSTPEN